MTRRSSAEAADSGVFDGVCVDDRARAAAVPASAPDNETVAAPDEDPPPALDNDPAAAPDKDPPPALDNDPALDPGFVNAATASVAVMPSKAISFTPRSAS
ncbi:MAG TPA: hypothetical protein VK933_16365 [Longimicrobiales bacterium]|nr:hypothetical protein [Longimicrobiales bacterium]